jgi:FlgD Ig-like domain
VCAAAGVQGPVVMSSDQAGGAILAWVDGRVSESDIYARRVSSAGTPLWASDGIPICTATNLQLHLQLVGLPDASAVAVWRDYRALPASGIYAQRIAIDGSLAWPADGRLVDSSPQSMDRFALVNGLGDSTYVTWSTSSGVGGDVFAQKLDGNGGLPWGEDRTTVCHGPNDQTYATAAPDGSGGFYVAYRDRRNPAEPNPYAHHVGPGGMPGPLPLDVPPGDRAPAARLRGMPNPARGAQVLAFARPVSGGARAEVLDIGGRRRALRPLAAGAVSWTWDGRGDDGARVEPGVYLVRVTDGPNAAVARLVRLD